MRKLLEQLSSIPYGRLADHGKDECTSKKLDRAEYKDLESVTRLVFTTGGFSDFGINDEFERCRIVIT